MKKVRSLLLAAVLGTWVLGCASMGRPFNHSAVATFQPGITTEAQVISAFGTRPTHRTTTPTVAIPGFVPGDYLLGWAYAHASLGGAHGESVTLLFNHEGVLKSVVNEKWVDQ